MNASLTAMVDMVYTETNRPDLVDRTIQKVKEATLKMHKLDFFVRDLFETGVQFGAADFFHQLNTKQLIPLYRAFKYLRLYDPTATQQPDVSSRELKFISVDQALDEYNCLRTNVVYPAGLFLNIRTCISSQYFILGCYVSPNVTEDNYASWVAEDYPYAIVEEASRAIFKSIGRDEENTSIKELAAEQVAMLRMTEITGKGD